MKSKLLKGKKGMEWLSIILILLVIVIGGYVLMKSRTSFADAAKKYSSEEFGDFGDADHDDVVNSNDQCPAKACDPKLSHDSIEKNPSSDRYGCTDTQVPCGTSMECRQAPTC